MGITAGRTEPAAIFNLGTGPRRGPWRRGEARPASQPPARIAALGGRKRKGKGEGGTAGQVGPGSGGACTVGIKVSEAVIREGRQCAEIDCTAALHAAYLRRRPAWTYKALGVRRRGSALDVRN